ncbi:uncharacterized protein RSE6_01685 [Rhynchosporium secalis]|uniref:Uncharacterized protein n=1 Tax=Rhynchosporium secalis TaxID=38038 RepID=A0A1E1LYG4_RHYSE|nr:uncharacterized protein RSE6_01685 [Rhynchosporium secalis]
MHLHNIFRLLGLPSPASLLEEAAAREGYRRHESQQRQHQETSVRLAEAGNSNISHCHDKSQAIKPETCEEAEGGNILVGLSVGVSLEGAERCRTEIDRERERKETDSENVAGIERPVVGPIGNDVEAEEKDGSSNICVNFATFEHQDKHHGTKPKDKAPYNGGQKKFIIHGAGFKSSKSQERLGEWYLRHWNKNHRRQVVKAEYRRLKHAIFEYKGQFFC